MPTMEQPPIYEIHVYEKEWELNKLNEKINQLQQSLSQANLALNNERRRIIAFNSEIDTFKSKYLNYFYLFL